MESNITYNPKAKFVLIGTRTDSEYGYGGWTGKTEEIEKPVATFETKEAAKKYAESCKLKHPTRHSVFKAKTLLALYDSYEIEEYDSYELQHFEE